MLPAFLQNPKICRGKGALNNPVLKEITKAYCVMEKKKVDKTSSADLEPQDMKIL